jgi:hypothetical protein
MAETVITEISFEREAAANKDGSVFGTLTVGTTKFPTIERGKDFVNLKQGSYVMKHSTKVTGRKVNCLRPEIVQITTLLIHDALGDSSNNLEGCIAPGMEKKASNMGIRRSAEAMDAIWKLLGGFEEGKKVTLNVLNNVPGESRTKDTWDRLK